MSVRHISARAMVGAFALAAWLGGCGGAENPVAPPKPPTPTATPAPPPAPGSAAVRPLDPGAGRALPPLAYDARGRRDPFAPVALPSGSTGINIAAAKLVGIVRSPSSAFALVEGPDGVGYILRNGDALGNGRVTNITNSTVTFAVAAQPGQGPSTVTLRLVLD
jgi:hypothetical protein